MEDILNTECSFIIFSNDKELNISKYKEQFKRVFVSKNTVAADHYLMSKADYIIGPPSTFSMWASYIGETSYYHIYNKDEILSLDKFIICNG